MLVAQLKTLARQSAIYGTADVFGTLINFLLLPLLTRYLTPADYGTLGILLLFGVTTKILFRMGLDAGFFRIYYDQKTNPDRRAFSTTIVASAAAVSLGLFGLTAFFAEPIARLLLGRREGELVILVAADTLLNSFAFVPMNTFRIEGRPGYFTGVSVFRNAVNAGLKVALVVSGWGVRGVLWSDVASSALFVAALAPALLRGLGWGFSAKMLREAAAFGLPKVPHGLAYQALNLADRKLLDLLSTRYQVGLYHVAYQFGTGVKFFLSAFELAWTPFVFSQMGTPGAGETLARIATYAGAALVALGLAISVFAREILALMTAPAYHSAYPVIPVVALAHLFQGVFILTSIGIGISKKAYYYPVMTFCAAAVNISSNLALIPGLGMMGAAWATVAGYAVMAGMGIYFSQLHYPIPFEWARLGRIAAAAGISYTASLAAPEPLPSALLVKAVSLLLFPLALFALGFFRHREMEALRGILSGASTRVAEAPPPPPAPL